MASAKFEMACSLTRAFAPSPQPGAAQRVIPHHSRVQNPTNHIQLSHNGCSQLRLPVHGLLYGRNTLSRVAAMDADLDSDLIPLPDLAFDDDEEKDELDNWNLLRIVHR
jgi:hypothetical protein